MGFVELVDNFVDVFLYFAGDDGVYGFVEAEKVGIVVYEEAKDKNIEEVGGVENFVEFRLFLEVDTHRVFLKRINKFCNIKG